jgi:uncharacterized protein
METVTVSDVDVDRCTGCGGLWFDMLEHEKLRHVKGSETIDTGDPKRGREQSQKGDIDCPNCHARMVKMVDHEQPHIWFEQCSVCGGTYFDAGEFKDFKSHTIGDFFRRLRARPRM